MSRRADRSGWSMDSKVYVGGLELGADKERLRRIFKDYGTLKNIWVARNPPGFAFVEFKDPLDAQDAVRALDGTTLYGHRLKIQMSTANTREDRSTPRLTARRYMGLSSDTDWSTSGSRSRSRSHNRRSSSSSNWSSGSRSRSFTPESERSTLSRIYRHPYKPARSPTHSKCSSGYSYNNRRRPSDSNSSYSSIHSHSSYRSTYSSDENHYRNKGPSKSEAGKSSQASSDDLCLILGSGSGSCPTEPSHHRGTERKNGSNESHKRRDLSSSSDSLCDSGSWRCRNSSAEKSVICVTRTSCVSREIQRNYDTVKPQTNECGWQDDSRSEERDEIRLKTEEQNTRGEKNFLRKDNVDNGENEKADVSTTINKIEGALWEESTKNGNLPNRRRMKIRRNCRNFSMNPEKKSHIATLAPHLEHHAEVKIENPEFKPESPPSKVSGHSRSPVEAMEPHNYTSEVHFPEASAQTDLYLLLHFVQQYPEVLTETFLTLNRDHILSDCHYPEIVPSKYQRNSRVFHV